MRLCGHDRVVSDRYDSGSVGSGRYFYRLDPQDPLNFGRNLLSLVLTRASGPVPPCRSPNWHKERTWRYTGTEKELICNARDTRAIVYPSRSVREPVGEVAQDRATGRGCRVYLGVNQAREPERHRPTLRGQPGIDPLCQATNQPQPVGPLAQSTPDPDPSGSTIHHIRPRDPERHRITPV